MDSRARQHRHLAALFGEIQQARQALRVAHRVGASPTVARVEERRLHNALNNYVVALTALSLPTPCVIRDELRIYSDLLALDRGQ